MRVLGLDVGDKRIGIAISDGLGLTAQRLSVLERRGLTADLQTLKALVQQHQASAIVVMVSVSTATKAQCIKTGNVEDLRTTSSQALEQRCRSN